MFNTAERTAWCLPLLLSLTLSTSVLANGIGNPHYKPQQPLVRRSHRSLPRHSKRATSESCIALLDQEEPVVQSVTDATLAASNATVPTAPKKDRTTSNSTTTHTCKKSKNLGLSSKFLSNNGVYWGFLPDNGDSGGSYQSPVALNKALGKKAATIGLYAHLIESKPFDCTELTDIGGSETAGYSGLYNEGVKTPSEIKGYKKNALLEQVVASGSILVASTMPVYSWAGLTKANNSQAIALAKCMKKFTDRGVEVWLRFAHEMNYYQSDYSTSEPTLNGQKIYAGQPSDFLEAWSVVATTMRKMVPCVKMYWSPNAGDEGSISQFWPQDESTVDVIGIDWYPGDPNADLVGSYGWMHDKWANKNRIFTLGETGIGGSEQDKLTLMKNFSSKQVAQRLPFFKLINYFNYNKGTCFCMVMGCGPASGKSWVKTLTP